MTIYTTSHVLNSADFHVQEMSCVHGLQNGYFAISNKKGTFIRYATRNIVMKYKAFVPKNTFATLNSLMRKCVNKRIMVETEMKALGFIYAVAIDRSKPKCSTIGHKSLQFDGPIGIGK